MKAELETNPELAKPNKRVVAYLTESEYQAFLKALKKHGRYHSISDAIRDFIRDFVDSQVRPVEHPHGGDKKETVTKEV